MRATKVVKMAGDCRKAALEIGRSRWTLEMYFDEGKLIFPLLFQLLLLLFQGSGLIIVRNGNQNRTGKRENPVAIW